jgi:transposase-like protein
MITLKEAMKDHIHHVKRLRAGSRDRYECLDCGKRFRILSGVIIEDVEGYEARKRADFEKYLEELKDKKFSARGESSQAT